MYQVATGFYFNISVKMYKDLEELGIDWRIILKRSLNK
jgi:hypothetical protein